jgi:hypothetical protein
MLLSEETRRRLGDEGLAELAACLWSVDCQTCGTLLGDDPPALVVDDTYVTATASLHHQGCRSPEWNDSAVIRRAAGDYVSYVVRMMLIPVAEGRREAEPWPLMVVNPGLESVALARDKDGRWHVEHGAGFDGAGLVRPGPGTAGRGIGRRRGRADHGLVGGSVVPGAPVHGVRGAGRGDDHRVRP